MPTAFGSAGCTGNADTRSNQSPYVVFSRVAAWPGGYSANLPITPLREFTSLNAAFDMKYVRKTVEGLSSCPEKMATRTVSRD